MNACPACAEQIQDAAVKCRFCGADLRVVPAAATKTCPECAEEIPANATVCPLCQASLQEHHAGVRTAIPEPAKPQDPQRGRRWLRWVAVAIVMMVVPGGGAALVLAALGVGVGGTGIVAMLKVGSAQQAEKEKADAEGAAAKAQDESDREDLRDAIERLREHGKLLDTDFAFGPKSLAAATALMGMVDGGCFDAGKWNEGLSGLLSISMNDNSPADNGGSLHVRYVFRKDG